MRSLLESVGLTEYLGQDHQRGSVVLERVGLLGEPDRRSSQALGLRDRSAPRQHSSADAPPPDLGVDIVEVGCGLADLGQSERLVVMALLDQYLGQIDR